LRGGDAGTVGMRFRGAAGAEGSGGSTKSGANSTIGEPSGRSGSVGSGKAVSSIAGLSGNGGDADRGANGVAFGVVAARDEGIGGRAGLGMGVGIGGKPASRGVWPDSTIGCGRARYGDGLSCGALPTQLQQALEFDEQRHDGHKGDVIFSNKPQITSASPRAGVGLRMDTCGAGS